MLKYRTDDVCEECDLCKLRTYLILGPHVRVMKDEDVDTFVVTKKMRMIHRVGDICEKCTERATIFIPGKTDCILVSNAQYERLKDKLTNLL